MKEFDRLVDIMKQLRNPDGGCLWDLEQSYDTIIPHTLEEAYEVADAIERKDFDELKSELGDLLFQVIFYAQLATEDDLFTINDVLKDINEKMVSRHPHVFDKKNVDSADDVVEQWDAIKAQEKPEKQLRPLEAVTKGLPALLRAQKLKKKAAELGFDWPSEDYFRAKIEEELEEVYEALDAPNKDFEHIEEEFGDVLYCIADLARYHGVNAEESLRKGNKKFELRFHYFYKRIQELGKPYEEMTFEEKDLIWQEAKAFQKS